MTKFPAWLSHCDDVFDLSVDKLENICGRDDNLIMDDIVALFPDVIHCSLGCDFPEN